MAVNGQTLNENKSGTIHCIEIAIFSKYVLRDLPYFIAVSVNIELIILDLGNRVKKSLSLYFDRYSSYTNIFPAKTVRVHSKGI